MKKLWFGLFAFVLSLCCGFALLHGSYTRSNFIAHSSAYTDYDVNDSDDSPYWEQTDYDLDAFYENVLGANGYAYKIYVDSVLHDDDPEDTYYEYVLKVYVFDGTDVVSHSVNDLAGNDWEYGFADYNFYNYYFDGSVFRFSSPNGVGVFDPVSYQFSDNFDYFPDTNMYFDGHLFYLNSFGYTYIDSTQFSVGDYSLNEDYLFFTDGTYVYIDCGLDSYDDLMRISSDCTYVVYDGLAASTEVEFCWSDGKYAYYDNGSTHMIFDSESHTWSNHVWTGYTGSFDASNLWTDGNEIYMTLSNGTTYRLHINHPYVSPYPNVLAEMIALITSGIAGIAEGIGANLSVLAESVMIDANTGNLSAFGSLVVIMAGLALALHLCRWVVNFVTSLGRRDR